MPKKMYLKGNPRKFSDKIALIKQKEALSNASFQSAIHGLTEITMNRIPGKDVENLEVKDNCSSNSPESFTSESTAPSFKTAHPFTNDQCELKMENLVVNNNNDVFKSCQELPQNYDNRPFYQHEEVKFRHGSDRTQLQTQEARYSNIEGYYPNNKNLRRVFEPVSSGSLPDVSMWCSPNEYTARYSEETKGIRDSSTSDHIDLRETLSNLEQVKLGKNSKLALLEHLKNRAMQNVPNVHPHHIQSINDSNPMALPTIISSPSLHRASGHAHDHDGQGCAGNPNESGHLKHYSMSNSPYLSLPHRERPSCKDVDSGFYQRPIGGIANPSLNYMKLNINCDSKYDNSILRNKALTPTGQQSNTWFDNSGTEINTGFLYPQMFSNVLANENGRRVASDSNIQNSLKYQNDRVTPPNNLNDSPFERVNSLRGEPSSYSYQRNQSMTAYPTQNTQNNNEVSSQVADYQRESSQLSVSSSFYEHIFGMKSPDENLDPSLLVLSDSNSFKTPDHNQGQVFVFKELKNPSNIVGPDIGNIPPFPKDDDYGGNDVDMKPYRKQSDNNNAMSCNDSDGNIQDFDNSNINTSPHECYWGQSNDSNVNYIKELSPTIKPCNDLDPKNVIVDIYTDFDGIADVPFADADTQRRDSLNWTDEVLRNLQTDPSNGDSTQGRERSMSVYQPMIPLTEEEKTLADVNEYL